MSNAQGNSKKGKAGYAALGGHLHDSLPIFDMAEVYNTTLVTIFVSNDQMASKFKVPREQICGHSSTILGAFKKSFKEAKDKTFNITEQSPVAFAVLLTYIQTLMVGLGSWPVTLQAPDTFDSNTWTWQFLFECFVLADYLGARLFMQRMFEAIQSKYIMKGPTALAFAADLKYL